MKTLPKRFAFIEQEENIQEIKTDEYCFTYNTRIESKSGEKWIHQTSNMTECLEIDRDINGAINILRKTMKFYKWKFCKNQFVIRS